MTFSPKELLKLRAEVGSYYQSFVASIASGGGGSDTGAFLHNSGSGPVRKLELPKLAATAASNAAGNAIDGRFNAAAIELRLMGNAVSGFPGDTGKAG